MSAGPLRRDPLRRDPLRPDPLRPELQQALGSSAGSSTSCELSWSAAIGTAKLDEAAPELPGLHGAIANTRDWLLDQQEAEGFWCGELEGDTILESEYILLLAWLGREQGEQATRAARYVLQQQLPTGGWALFPDGPVEISASVKAYFALKITGHDPHSPEMCKAREAIHANGGAERVNSFTRYYLAILGIISYQQCPSVPPEMMFAPRWFPINIHAMSAWSRTIVVPLSLIWAFQPTRKLPAVMGIDELFLRSPAELPVSMPPCDLLDGMTRKTWINWEALFRGLDRTWKVVERLRIKPLRRPAIQRAADWMTDRFAMSDGLGAIFPPIVWSVIALRCLGYEEDSPEVSAALGELEKLVLSDGDADRLQPCKSPVWDTAISTIALREAGVPSDHPAIERAAQWLLSKEVRNSGDCNDSNRGLEPAGWYFEFNNEFYPDVDDTIMVVMALARCLPKDEGCDWRAFFVPTGPRGYTSDADIATVIGGRVGDSRQALDGIEKIRPLAAAMRRGVEWVLKLQSRNGGWGAFDADNDRELLTRVPFADHNAMIDPPTADITARVFEMLGQLDFDPSHRSVERAMSFVTDDQLPDGSWYGRWGVNYIYGTWQVLVGLEAVGVSPADARMQRGADWLKTMQQSDGGWGETCRSYEQPELRGQGITTPSQTAWALMGLMAAGETTSPAVTRGIQYLLDTQNDDGTWDETEFTGTGFPKVFYLRYHLYRIYWPLMALGRYARIVG